jgi:hypothetical protein
LLFGYLGREIRGCIHRLKSNDPSSATLC